MYKLFKKRDGCNVVINDTILDRIFDSIKIEKRFKDENICLIWKKKTSVFSICTKQKTIAHWIYDLCVGEINVGYKVIQKCDRTKICIRPDHLDCVRNGRLKTINNKNELIKDIEPMNDIIIHENIKDIVNKVFTMTKENLDIMDSLYESNISSGIADSECGDGNSIGSLDFSDTESLLESKRDNNITKPFIFNKSINDIIINNSKKRKRMNYYIVNEELHYT